MHFIIILFSLKINIHLVSVLCMFYFYFLCFVLHFFLFFLFYLLRDVSFFLAYFAHMQRAYIALSVFNVVRDMRFAQRIHLLYIWHYLFIIVLHLQNIDNIAFMFIVLALFYLCRRCALPRTAHTHMHDVHNYNFISWWIRKIRINIIYYYYSWKFIIYYYWLKIMKIIPKIFWYNNLFDYKIPWKFHYSMKIPWLEKWNK